MHHPRRLSLVERAAPALLALSTLCLASCDREDIAAQSLQDAAAKVHALNQGGTLPGSREVKEKTLKAVLSTLKNLGPSPTPSQKAAASLLSSQASAGLAAGPAQDATDKESEALHQITLIRAELDQYLVASGRAKAAVVDSAADLAALDKEDQDRQKRIADAQARKAQIESRIAGLRAESQKLAEQGKARQNEAALLRQQAVSQSATAAEGLLRQASEIGRAADKLEAQSAQIAAQADQIAPEAPAAELEVKRLTGQRELLAKARQDLMKRDAAAKADAAAARAEAAKSAERIATGLKAIEELRSGELATATDAAVAGYTSAASLAKAATSEIRAGASAGAAAAQQALGDVLWSKAHGLSSYAQLLGALAGADPALPGADAIKAKAKQAAEDRDTAANAAAEAYQAAKTAYMASGSSADAKARIETLDKRLIEIIKLASNGKIDLAPPPPEGAAPASEGEKPSEGTHAEAPAADGIPAELRAAIDLAIMRLLQGKADEFASDAVGDEQSKSAMRGAIALMAKFERLNQVLTSKFGQGLPVSKLATPLKSLGFVPGMSSKDMIITMKGADAAEAKSKEEQATGKTGMLFAKVDGKWKPDIRDESDSKMAQGLPKITALTSAVDQTIADIESGKIKDLQAAMLSLSNAIRPDAGNPPKSGGN